MSSFAIRNCTKFNITTSLEFNKKTTSSVKVGKITPTNKTISINDNNYQIFDCEYYKNKNNEILVDGTPHLAYQEISRFNLYYSPTRNFLILNTSISDSKLFLQYLEQTNSDLVSYTKIIFDFNKIVKQNGVYMDQIWFGTNDKHVRTKFFNGVEVNQDKEAQKAINDGKATYIKVKMDVNSNGDYRQRSLGFSARSGIVIIQPNDPSIDSQEKKLQLLLDIYNTYQKFK